jgi:hypothetical protein
MQQQAKTAKHIIKSEIMTKLSGKCLCGDISFSCDTEIKKMANGHCSDCQAATGAAFGTLVFVDNSDVEISGSPKVFKHTADSGSDMEKLFCSKCGSQLFGRNSGRPNMLSIRAGVIDQSDLIKPAVNVYMDSRIPSSPIDPALKAFPKMPG